MAAYSLRWKAWTHANALLGLQSLDDGIPIIEGRAGAPIAPVLDPSDPAQCTALWEAAAVARRGVAHHGQSANTPRLCKSRTAC